MKRGGSRAGWVAAAMGLAACGGSVAVGQTGGTSSGAGGAPGTTTSSGGGAGATTSSSSGAGGQSPGCEAAIDAIAMETSGQGSCTAVVRLDYASLEILGFQIVCGPYGQPTETSARTLAQQDTGFGQTGESLAGALPADEFVFWQSAGDFGGSAAVSRRNGLSVFGGSTVWGGQGDITYPKSWKPADAIGIGCTSPGVPGPQGTGWDLGGGQPLSQAQVGAALAVVWQTALPGGMWKGGYVFDEVVLLYPRSVGAFDPTNAEWIVLVNSGFLE